MAGISKSQKLELSNIAVELDTEEVRLIRYVLESYFTMTSVARLVNTLKACKSVSNTHLTLPTILLV